MKVFLQLKTKRLYKVITIIRLLYGHCPSLLGLKTGGRVHNRLMIKWILLIFILKLPNLWWRLQTAGTSPYTFPIINYLYPENYQSAVNQLAVTLPIMNLFENLFGTYPFHQEKYGHAQFGWGGGMEHTTVSFMGSFSRGLIAHELAHHWFGNKVTCGTWQDIWINEGFAEYMAGLVVASLYGDEPFANWKK